MNVEYPKPDKLPSAHRRGCKQFVWFFLIFLVAVLGFTILLYKANERTKLCTTSNCARTASHMISTMNPSADPCHDFFEFACGNFNKSFFLYGDQETETSLGLEQKKMMERYAGILVEDIRPHELRAFSLSKNFYKACMNHTRIEEQGLQPLIHVIEAIGGWPILQADRWDAEKWNLSETFEKIINFGFSPILFEISDSNDVIQIMEPDLTLNNDSMIAGLNDTETRVYYEYMVDMAVYFGAEKDRAETEIYEVLQFEVELANATNPSLQQTNSSETEIQLLTLEQMLAEYPYINWMNNLNLLLSTEAQVDKNTEINVYNPVFFENLGKLLAKTPKRIISNYLMLKVVREASAFLNDAVRLRSQRYANAVANTFEQRDRWEECVDLSKRFLWISLDAQYVRKYFKPEFKRTVEDMGGRIRQAYRIGFKNHPHIDNDFRKIALEKLDAMDAVFGYQKELMNDGKIADHYRDVEVDPQNFFSSWLQLSKYKLRHTLNRSLRKMDPNDFDSHSMEMEINAVYIPAFNILHMSAPILQLYASDLPHYMNYGSVGFIIGHEIAHGFDDCGRKYDKNTDEIILTDEDTVQYFKERESCLVKQYNNFTEPLTKLKINGTITLGENIADNVGMRIAYNAYTQWANTNAAEPRLPGFGKYTPHQMFWMSAASLQCGIMTAENIESNIAFDPHTHPKFRLIGALQNLEEFSRDFKCPLGSPMNPKHKCHVL